MTLGIWHARLSASDTKRWANCPGSIAFEELNPHLKKEGSVYAREGTCAHKLVELCLEKGHDAEEYGGRIIRIVVKDGKEVGTSMLRKGARLKDELDFEVTGDMIEAVQACVDYVRGVLDIYVEDACTVTAIKNGFLKLERRVNPLPERDDTGGTGDITLDIFPDLYETVDYKHGQGVLVPVERNHQLRTYLRGGVIEDGATGYAKYRTTICQPRHKDTPPDGILSEDITEEELEAWTEELRGWVACVDQARAFTEDDQTIEGLYKAGFISVGRNASHCRFCDLKTLCPSTRNKAQEMASADFAEEDPDDFDDRASGANQLAVLLPWVDVMIDYWNAVRDDAKGHMLNGGKIDGFKVVRGRSPGRTLKEGMTPEMMVDTAVEMGAKREACFAPPKPAAPLSGPKIEKLIPKDKRKRFSDATMFTPEGKLDIAPIDDKRPAVTVNAADDFKGETDE